MGLLKDSEDARDVGAKNMAEVRRLLLRRHGTFVRAWRLCLDRDGNGRLSFLEFCRAAREVGYAGNVQTLWSELDNDGSGFVSLKEVDLDTYEILHDFLACVKDRYNTWKDCWAEAFDVGGSHRLGPSEFAAGCKRIGYFGNARTLFN